MIDSFISSRYIFRVTDSNVPHNGKHVNTLSKEQPNKTVEKLSIESLPAKIEECSTDKKYRNIMYKPGENKTADVIHGILEDGCRGTFTINCRSLGGMLGLARTASKLLKTRADRNIQIGNHSRLEVSADAIEKNLRRSGLSKELISTSKKRRYYAVKCRDDVKRRIIFTDEIKVDITKCIETMFRSKDVRKRNAVEKLLEQLQHITGKLLLEGKETGIKNLRYLISFIATARKRAVENIFHLPERLKRSSKIRRVRKKIKTIVDSCVGKILKSSVLGKFLDESCDCRTPFSLKLWKRKEYYSNTAGYTKGG